MYSIVAGITHPRIGKNLDHKNLEFFDIGETESEMLIVKNLMKDILNYDKNKNIVKVFEEFFRLRAISTKTNNLHYKRILNFFVEYNKTYLGYKSSGIKYYLVKRNIKENKILDVISVWKSNREKEEFSVKKSKKKSK